ncbi:serine hydrolase domain-containing protein [Bacteroidota bacterium]
MKGMLKYFLFLFFFIGDIAFIFSDKGLEDENKYDSFPLPLSYNITNEHSNNNTFHNADSIFTKFIIDNNIKGASIAIAKEGKLVMAKGYGYANFENEEIVEPRHIFRIASVSKLLTAIGIMKLYEEGEIDIHDKVFGEDGYLKDSSYLSKINDSRVYDITIHQLLNHSGGWSRKRPDPMFSYFTIARRLKRTLPIKMDDVMEYTLAKNLDFNPGSRSSYSNFGYALLGEIIEEISKQSYEDFIKENVLFPLEIYDMHLARSFYHQKHVNEVSYYETDKQRKVPAFNDSRNYVQKAYGGNDMELIAPTGGWLASPSELMKLLLAVDGFNSKPDILSKESVEMMVDTKDIGVPYGWKGSSNGFWWRTGTLTGTSALMARQSNELCWIVIFNTSTKNATRFPRYVHLTINKMLRSINEWPEYDLFQYDHSKNNSLFAIN